MKYVFLTLLMAISLRLLSQEVKQVVNSSGGAINNELYSLKFSVGEVAISTFLSSEYSISEGLFAGDITSPDPKLSVEKGEILNVEIFPNPSTDIVKVIGAHDYSAIRIFDSSGREVLSQDIVNNSFSILSLIPGNYLVFLVDGQNQPSTVVKLIKH